MLALLTLMTMTDPVQVETTRPSITNHAIPTLKHPIRMIVKYNLAKPHILAISLGLTKAGHPEDNSKTTRTDIHPSLHSRIRGTAQVLTNALILPLDPTINVAINSHLQVDISHFQTSVVGVNNGLVTTTDLIGERMIPRRKTIEGMPVVAMTEVEETTLHLTTLIHAGT